MRNFVAVMIVGLALAAAPVQAKKPGADNDDEAFGKQEQGMGKQKSLPPGLQKKLDRGGELPPGWQKKLERGQVLDVEVEKQAKPVTRTIFGRLPKGAEDTEDLQVEDRVVRVLKDSRRIVDVFNISGERQ